MKFHIDKTDKSPLCRMCRVENEPISHIVSECKMLSRKEYRYIHRRHDNVCRYIHRKISKNMDLKTHNSATSMSQMELLRTNGTRFCEILQSSVIPRLMLDDQILLLLIKPRRKLKSQILSYLMNE